MKVYIIGPCSTGKTTLAKQLADKYKISSYTLDSFYIDFDSITVGSRSIYPREKIEKDLDSVLVKKDWIVEGTYLENRLLDAADRIIFTPRNIGIALLWQWKRFFIDPIQIKKWGIWNNILLSSVVLNQFFGKGDFYLFQEVNYPTCKYLAKMLADKRYVSKVQVLRDKETINVIK